MDDCSSIELLARAQDGHQDALDALMRRYLPAMTRWAHGRLPQWARSLRDTQDLVQDVVADTLKQLPRLHLERSGGFHAYLKAATLNRIKNELRSASRRPHRTDLADDVAVAAQSPFDLLMMNENAERYEAALARLSPPDREAIIARFEFGLSGRDLAAALRRSTVDAARMAVTRAVLRLTKVLAGPPASI